MAEQQAYMIIDIGTGNVRVAITRTNGDIICVERDNVVYEHDHLYADALHFRPDRLWAQIVELSKRALQKAEAFSVVAITTSSQREGIVLIDAQGKGLIGLPNHDHRGRGWENEVSEKSDIYKLTGRYPGSLFSALKVVGIRHRRPELFNKLHRILSISDWALYMLTGIEGYEHSQASETQLYDVSRKSWSTDLCALFGLNESILPPLHHSGAILGNVLPQISADLKISPETQVVVGGADTQLAIKSTKPAVGDIVVVSGTTTPIVKIIDHYIVDEHERSWTNRHVDEHNFVLETNAGVTGLNYQRLKSIFYPNEEYSVIEAELNGITDPLCVASLGSLISDEKKPLTKGGFMISTPLSHELTRACFVWAALWDIACSIRENFYCLTDITPYYLDYVWACGGGFQSKMLRQSIANLINKKVRIRPGFQQASVTGGSLICNETLGVNTAVNDAFEEVIPQKQDRDEALYLEWKKIREDYKKVFG